jgi:hypothetical protein
LWVRSEPVPLYTPRPDGSLQRSDESVPLNPLSGLKEKVREHWRKFNPRKYNSLVSAGQLEQELSDVVRRTGDVYFDAVNSGLTFDGAWELAREEWLLPPESEP